MIQLSPEELSIGGIGVVESVERATLEDGLDEGEQCGQQVFARPPAGEARLKTQQMRLWLASGWLFSVVLMRT